MLPPLKLPKYLFFLMSTPKPSKRLRPAVTAEKPTAPQTSDIGTAGSSTNNNQQTDVSLSTSPSSFRSGHALSTTTAENHSDTAVESYPPPYFEIETTTKLTAKVWNTRTGVYEHNKKGHNVTVTSHSTDTSFSSKWHTFEASYTCEE